MNAREIKLVVVVVLFTAVAGSVYWFYIREEVKPVAEASKKKEVAAMPPATKIRLEMMRDEGSGDDAVNIFNYRKENLVAAAAPVEQPIMQVIPPAPPPVRPPTTPTTSNAPARPAEPNVVNVQLTYSGFARDDNNEMIAFIETPQTTVSAAGHYNLREDDFLLGRFKVAKITAEQVEVEDMDRPETSASRKQTIAFKK